MVKQLSVAELREAYLAFFEAKGHTRHPSASLVPENDPTTLFTVAGMAQFKDMFLGRGTLPFKRVTTCQKCIRTNDIMQVGRTPRHHTFFEMLGNFSFDDYFKRETIAWAWEFLTGVLEMPAERLWISVHHTDDEAAAIWRDEIGVDAKRIVRMGDDDNFWPAGAPADGPTGPGGYCSEIFWDYQTNDDPADSPANETDTGRFVEIWNLVFPQFNVSEPKVEGRYTLQELGRTNIDTGSGLERLACVLQGKVNNFDTDLFQSIIAVASEVSGVAYVEGRDGEQDQLLRRIADHVRAVTFCIADGALPGNTGRGYIVRRLIRRATLDLDKLGCKDVGLYKVVAPVVACMGEAYPGVAAREQLAAETLASEEKQFRRTLDRGLELLKKAVARHRAAGEAVFSGDDLFDLFTTYGFPHEMTEDLVEAEGFSVDRARFDQRMAEFAEISKGGREIEVFSESALQDAKPRLGATPFVGYGELEAETEITLLELDGDEVQAAPEGSQVRLALSRTPFYAESGGQVADTGTITGDGFVIRVEDVQKDEGLFVHRGVVASGTAAPGPVRCAVDSGCRGATTRHHSATHLMHSALNRVLGDHIEQQGSKVEPGLLRFDFNHPSQPSRDELAQVEAWVNEQVAAGIPVETREMPIDEARATGAKALFGEKYGDVVRVVSMGGKDVSVELCGGCHVANTADIGGFRIIREEASSAGIRRIVAVAGDVAKALDEQEAGIAAECGAAIAYPDATGAEVAALARALKAAPEELPARVRALAAEAEGLGVALDGLTGPLAERVAGLQDAIKKVRREADKAQAQAAVAALDDIIAGGKDVAGIRFIAAELQVDGKGLRQAGETLMQKAGSCAALLGSRAGGKAVLLAVVSEDLVGRGLKAGELIQRVAPVVGGRGGGKPDQAQGGGPDADKLGDALAAGEAAVADLMGSG